MQYDYENYEICINDFINEINDNFIKLEQNEKEYKKLIVMFKKEHKSLKQLKQDHVNNLLIEKIINNLENETKILNEINNLNKSIICASLEMHDYKTTLKYI